MQIKATRYLRLSRTTSIKSLKVLTCPTSAEEEQLFLDVNMSELFIVCAITQCL